MNNGGRFTWQAMGKPDYSQCAAYVASLPHDIRLSLNLSEIGVLTQVLYLCWYHATHSGRGSAFAIPSENYLAKAIGRSVRTVQRCVRALWAMGLIEVTHRRPIKSRWQSNLYGLGKRLLAVIYATAGKKTQQNQRPPLLAYNNLKKGIEGVTPTDAPSVSPSSREKLQALLDGFALSRRKPSAQEPQKEGTAWTERKELLKKQAEMLKRDGL